VTPFRIVSGIIGIMAAVLAIARDDRTLVWIAIGLLGSSIAVRIAQRIQSRRERDDSDPTDPGR